MMHVMGNGIWLGKMTTRIVASMMRRWQYIRTASIWMRRWHDMPAETRDRAGDLQIFSLTLSQLSYRGHDDLPPPVNRAVLV